MSIPSSFRRTFFYSHLFLALCAAAMWSYTSLSAGLSWKFSPSLQLLIASTVVYYNFHKFSYRFGSLHPLRIGAALLDPSVRPADRLLFVLGGSVFVAGFVRLSVTMMLAWLIVIGCSLLYTLPLLSSFAGFRRLREIPWLKPVVVSFVWSATTAIFPLLEAGITQGFLPVFFSAFAFVFALCVPFEIRDHQREVERNIPSVMKFGRKRVIALALLLVALTVLLQLQHYLNGTLSLPGFLSYLLPLLLSIVWMLVTRPDWPGWYFKGVVDGTMLLPYLFLILFKR